jgi:hypothetical protein
VLIILIYRIIGKDLFSIWNEITRRILAGAPFTIPWLKLDAMNPREAVQLSQQSYASAPGHQDEERGRPGRVLLDAIGVGADEKILLALGDANLSNEFGMIGTGDALALSLIQEALSACPQITVEVNAFRRNSVKPEDIIKQYSTIFAIGGPHSNPLTEYVLASGSKTTRFGAGGELLVDGNNISYKFSYAKDQGHEGWTDHGIVVCRANPFNPRGRLVLLAGTTTFGTRGAALALFIIAGNLVHQSGGKRGFF